MTSIEKMTPEEKQTTEEELGVSLDTSLTEKLVIALIIIGAIVSGVWYLYR